MAVTKDSTSSALVSKDLWNGAGDAPQLVDVLTQLAHFLEQIGYPKTVAALQKEASKNDITVISAEWERAIDTKTGAPLLELYELWQKKKKTLPTLPASDDKTSDSEESSDGEDDSEEDAAEGALVDVEAEETSDDDSDEKSESEGDSSSDEVETVELADSAVPDKKRKRSPSPASSDDSSSDDSDSSSDESQAPPAKKAKVKASATSSSNDTSSSESSSSSSSSDSDSDSGSDSSSDSPSSNSSSDSSSESSSDSSSDPSSGSESEAPPPVKKEKVKKEKKAKASKKDSVPAKVDHVDPVKEGSTASSATLEGDPPNVQESHIHPSRLRQVPSSDPAPAAESAKKLSGKKEIVPFSRIPVDQKVDPRFASNAYVSYDYADRAHQDLIVTKGKGFTKEKNKKKRGAYRGGAIDLTPKGIKFDD